MPTVEWIQPFTLNTSAGSYVFNSGTFPQMLLDQTACKASRAIRATTDPIPQGDGDIFHDRWSNGYEMTLVAQPWFTHDQFACPGLELNGTTVQDMRDELYEHLWALLRPDPDDASIVWTPTGGTPRMLYQIRLLDIADPKITDEGVVTFEFTIDTWFPYAQSQTGTTTNINGIGATITNNGNVPFWPVLKVYSDGISILNNTTGKQINMTAGCLGAGSYIEIETFRMTAYVDGDQANAKPCVNIQSTDFFPLVPGPNQINSSASVDFLYSDAWA